MHFGDLSEDVDYDEEEISMKVVMMMRRRGKSLIPGAGNRRTPLLSRRSELLLDN